MFKMVKKIKLSIKKYFTLMTIVFLCFNFFSRSYPATAASLNSKKNEKTLKNTKSKIKIKSESITKISKLSPIFLMSAEPNLALFKNIVAHDQVVLSSLNLAQIESNQRELQIQQLEANLKMQPANSIQSLEMNENLSKLYEEQCTYLSYIYTYKIKDNQFSDIESSMRTCSSQMLHRINVLLKQFPKYQQSKRWQANAILNQFRFDSTTKSRENALKFIKTAGKNNNEARRIVLYGIVSDALKKIQKSPFGTIEQALKIAEDPVSKSIVKLLMAASLKSNQVALYSEVLRESENIKFGSNVISPIVFYAAQQLVKVALKNNLFTANSNVVALLQSAGMSNVAGFYLEQVALNNLKLNPQKSISQYRDIVTLLSKEDSQNTDKIKLRTLDIALVTKQNFLLESEWQKILQDSAFLSSNPQLLQKAIQTQTINWQNFKNKPSPSASNQFVRMHDGFKAQFTGYAQLETWEFKVLEALLLQGNFKEVARRAEEIAEKHQGSVAISALQFAIKAREKILGIEGAPFRSNKNGFSDRGEPLASYISDLDKMVKIANTTDKIKYEFQAAYVVYESGEVLNGSRRMHDAINSNPNTAYAPQAVSYLLDKSFASKNFAAVEMTARTAETKHIRPTNKKYFQLRNIIENALYSQAEKLQAEKQSDMAAKKYMAFQKEFFSSNKADRALMLAADNFLSSNNTDASIESLELLLKSYPKSKLGMESRWKAAEQNKVTRKLLKAAQHYEIFAKDYPKQGYERRAWLNSALLHKELGRYSHSVANYEQALQQNRNNKQETKKILKEIADIQSEFGSAANALTALERLIAASNDVNEEAQARGKMVDIVVRQGGSDSSVKSIVRKILALRPTSQEGQQALVKAKFALANLEAKTLRQDERSNQAKLYHAVQKFITDYDNTKQLFLASCEVPGVSTCAMGYFETAKLAEDVAKKLMDIEFAPTLDPKEVEPTRKLISTESKRIAGEIAVYAAKAEQALAGTDVHAELAERIRSFAKETRGQQAPTVSNGVEDSPILPSPEQ